MAQAALPVNGTSHSPTNGQFASEQSDVEEQVVEYQAQLDELGGQAGRLAAGVARALDVDEHDDIERYAYYRRMERAIRAGAPIPVLLDAFHALVQHVEADELREDQDRIGLIPALARLATRAATLRSIFRADFVPRILSSFAKPRGRRAS